MDIVAERKAGLKLAKDGIGQTAEEAALRLERRSRLESLFRRRADGKTWYDGIMPHQWVGVCYGAVAKRWILADDPGLGKTRQSIGWLDLVGAQKVVVICENGTVEQFQDEFEEIAEHRTAVRMWGLQPAAREKARASLRAVSEGTVFVNYEALRDNKTRWALMAWQADTVIIDEAHNLKATATIAFDNVSELLCIGNRAHNTCPKCGHMMMGLSKPCDYCHWSNGEPTGYEDRTQLEQALATTSTKNLIMLTGTPILNSPDDLFPLLHFMNPALFSVHSTFRKAYLVKNHHTKRWVWRTGAVDRIKQLIDGQYLSRTLEDVGIVLPNRTIERVELTLDPKLYPLQHRTIRQISERAHIQLANGQSRTIFFAISVILYKRMANSWPGGIRWTTKDPITGEEIVLLDVGSEVKESVKIDALVQNVVKHWQGGRRQVVFSQFTTALDEVARRLTAQGLRVARIDGNVPAKQRSLVKADFYRAKTPGAGQYDVVLAQYRSGGTGLNLSAVTVSHELDAEWSPGKQAQARARSYRIGQTDETLIMKYILKGTVDVWLANLLESKAGMVGEFHGAMKSDSEALSELLEMLESGAIL
jgi:SNF2 family DNA or RNA helicase